MKKILHLFNLGLVFLCYGCKFNAYSNYNKEKIPLTLINSTGKEEIVSDLTKLYSDSVKSVITILNYANYYDRGKVVTTLYGSGSGFIYNCDDNYIYLYTNSHVVDVKSGYSQSYYEIVFFNGFRSYGDLIYSDSSEDVAIMRVNRTSQDFYVATIGDSDKVSPGEDVYVIGSPLGLEYCNTITKGIISNVNVKVDTDNDFDGNSITMYLTQIDASLNPGNSGGPLFNMKGEVIGVNTLKIANNEYGENIETFNFSIPSNHFVIVANSLAEKGSYNRPLIGISVIDIKEMSLKEREKYNITIDKGLYIESVSSNGILTKGTVIVKVNDRLVDGMSDFSNELYKYYCGDQIDITVSNVNGSNLKSYKITLK